MNITHSKKISGVVERKVEAFGENTIVHYCNCSMHDHAYLLPYTE